MDQYLNKKEQVRYHLFDSIRGICIVGMVVYHTLFDIAVFGGGGFDPAFLTVLNGIRDLGACIFILLSGVCFHFGSFRLRRFLVLTAAGGVVTLVTHLVLPEATVLFGILTFMGVSGGLMALCDRFLKKIPPAVGLSVSLLLFLVFFHAYLGYIGTENHVLAVFPSFLYRDSFTAFLGFPPQGFSSGDYYPLIPWFFIYCAGYYLQPILMKRAKPDGLLFLRIPLLAAVGRFSLPVYLLHQPVIYGAVVLFFSLMR